MWKLSSTMLLALALAVSRAGAATVDDLKSDSECTDYVAFSALEPDEAFSDCFGVNATTNWAKLDEEVAATDLGTDKASCGTLPLCAQVEQYIDQCTCDVMRCISAAYDTKNTELNVAKCRPIFQNDCDGLKNSTATSCTALWTTMSSELTGGVAAACDAVVCNSAIGGRLALSWATLLLCTAAAVISR